MAKLTDLKSLLDAARAARPRDDAHGADASATHAQSSAPAVRRTPAVAPVAGAPDRTVARHHLAGGKHAGDIDIAVARRRLAAGKHADGDIDIAVTFADVKRLPPRNRAAPTRPRPTAVARLRIEDEREALEMSKYGVEPSPHSWDIGQELEAEQTFLRRGLGTDILIKLRRGHWVVQRVLDLHGMTTDQAHDTLADFLLDARGQGLRCVRIIHGKGLTSPNREPVLKGKVRRWLSQWDDVLAYCEAAQHAGGSGAVVVLLRGR